LTVVPKSALGDFSVLLIR